MRLKPVDGMRFGRLVALRRAPNSARNLVRWLCLCDCGREKIVLRISLVQGHTKSCGCIVKELVANRVRMFGSLRERKSKRDALYRIKNLLRRQLASRTYYHQYYAAHRELLIKKTKRWQEKNRAKFNAICRKRMKRHVAEASEYYVRGLLRGSSLSMRDIPDELVRLKRAHLLLSRKLKNLIK